MLVRYILLYSNSEPSYIGIGMKVLADNIDLINLRDKLLENKRQIRLEKQKEALRSMKNSLVELAKKPIEKQISEYENFDYLVSAYQKYQVANDKIEQIISIEKLNKEIISYENSIKESNNYKVSPSDFSENKKKQYHFRLNSLKNNVYNDLQKHNWDRFNIRLYTATEWIAEDWALQNKLPYYDYNEINQRSPQDCQLNGIDIDVKTTIGVGRRHLKSYYSAKGTTYENEIILGIKSSAEKRDIIGTNEDISDHTIQGIFDPSLYNKINLELNYFLASTKLVNACYFQSLQSYFNLKPNYINRISNYDDDVFDYLIMTRNSLSAVFYLTVNYFPKKLERTLKLILPVVHHDLIAIITELNSKNSLALLPHYLADYLIGKIQDKEEIISEAINHAVCSIFWFHEDKQKYIKNLLKLSRVLPKVRCKFHQKESMKEMDIKLYEGKGPIPTIYAQCSKEPTNRTTIFTYSWKTGETLIYGNTGVEVCDSSSCGCLTHLNYGIRYGRRSCNKYGEKQQKIINSY